MLTSKQIAENEQLDEEYGKRGERRYPDPAGVFAAMEAREELHRLEKAVVEAARAELAAHSAPGTFGWTSNLYRAQWKLRSAVIDLIKFESQQIKK